MEARAETGQIISPVTQILIFVGLLIGARGRQLEAAPPSSFRGHRSQAPSLRGLFVPRNRPRLSKVPMMLPVAPSAGHRGAGMKPDSSGGEVPWLNHLGLCTFATAPSPRLQNPVRSRARVAGAEPQPGALRVRLQQLAHRLRAKPRLTRLSRAGDAPTCLPRQPRGGGIRCRQPPTCGHPQPVCSSERT